MQISEFDEFVMRQQNGNAPEGQVNWNQVRDEWLNRLDELYRNIEGWLRKYTSSGKISIQYKSIYLNEEDIGSYQARLMILRIGRQEVNLVPVGTRFIGFQGLVDVIGSVGKSSFVLANKDRSSAVPQVTVQILSGKGTRKKPEPGPSKVKWVWRILASPPERKLMELTEHSFFQLILEVTNG